MMKRLFMLVVSFLLFTLFYLLLKKGCNSITTTGGDKKYQTPVNVGDGKPASENMAVYAETVFAMPVSGGRPDVSLKQREERILFDGNHRVLRKWAAGISNPAIYDYHYGATGSLDSIVATSETGTFVKKWEYRYDQNGRKVAESCRSGGEHEERTFWQYNAEGKPIERLFYANNEKNAGQTVWEYAADGLTLLNEIAVDDAGSIKYVLNYTYDRQTGQTTCKKILPDGKLDGITYKKYNQADSLVSEIRCDSFGKPFGELRYSYDNRGNKTLEAEYDYPGPAPRLVKKTEFVYDRNGRLTESWHYADNPGQAVEKRVYEYENL